MKAAVRCHNSEAFSHIGELKRVFGEYGIEIVGAFLSECPISDSADAVVDFGAPGDGILIADFTQEAYVAAARAIAGEKHFAFFATYGVASDEIGRRACGLGTRAIAVFVRPSKSGAYVIARFGARTPKVDADAVFDGVRLEFADCIYAEREAELEEIIIEKLTESKRRIALAESFTGGGVTSRLTRVAGASLAVAEGIVAYTESAKTDRLGVEASTIAFHSAVSINAAYQMAAGLLRTGRAEVVLATTGYAGPTGKDVGKCFVAVGDCKRINIFEYRFAGTREEITDCGIRTALDRLADYLFEKVRGA